MGEDRNPLTRHSITSTDVRGPVQMLNSSGEVVATSPLVLESDSIQFTNTRDSHSIIHEFVVPRSMRWIFDNTSTIRANIRERGDASVPGIIRILLKQTTGSRLFILGEYSLPLNEDGVEMSNTYVAEQGDIIAISLHSPVVIDRENSNIRLTLHQLRTVLESSEENLFGGEEDESGESESEGVNFDRLLRGMRSDRRRRHEVARGIMGEPDSSEEGTPVKCNVCSLRWVMTVKVIECPGCKEIRLQSRKKPGDK